MKLEIKQTTLMEHLNYAIKGISNKNIIPVLNCIKFELLDEGLYLSSTDNDIAIKTFIDKKNIDKIIKNGEILVSGRFIYEIIKKLPNTLINIEEVMDNKIIITTSSSSFTLNCNNPGEFPKLDLIDSKNPILINKKLFHNIIKQTSFATSNQESRPVLTGINFKISDNILECTATDSYRLSKKKIELINNSTEKFNIIIPTKNLIELTRLYSNEDDDIEMHIFSNKIIFKFNSLIMMSRLINGTFPDTSKLIPQTFETTVKVNINDYYSAIDRASLLTNEEEKNIINLEIKENNMTISSNIPEIGNVEENLFIKNDKKSEIKIAFSSKFMLEAIKSLECEEIELLFNGEVKPIIIKNPESEDLIQLIVPIRTY